MVDLNYIILVGRLTRDPELRYTPSGTAVTTLPLAVSRQYTLPSGERREEVCYINVVVWDKQAQFCEKYLGRGRPVLVEGRLTSREYETQDGQKRRVIEVRARRVQQLDWQPTAAKEGAEYGTGTTPGLEPSEPPEVPPDDIPF